MNRCPSLLAMLSFTGLVVFCVSPEEKCNLGLWAFSHLEDLFWTTYQPTTGFPNLLQVALAPLPCLTSTWARAPPHPPPSPLWWTLLPPRCLCHRGLAHRGNLNKSSQLNIAHMYCQVRNFGFNMLESISKTGSALAPLVVDLGGQVGL